MRLENTFAVDAPIDAVHAAMLDVERVAPCVPGAEVLERTDEAVYKVAIKVKVGPISITYRGSVEVVENDPEPRRAVMRVRATRHGARRRASVVRFASPGGPLFG